MIRAFHAYKTFFNPRSRLLLVGSHAGFERYVAMLHGLIARLEVRDVHLVGHVSNEELAAYYDIADVFVSASEHEGFCVPLIESFHMGVPVLAYAATAVPSTMDGAGVLYTSKDPLHVAALINAVVDDREIAERIIHGQYAALDRLKPGILRERCSSRGWRARLATPRASSGGVRLLGSGRARREVRRAQAIPAGRLSGAAAGARFRAPLCPERAMIVNQWVPAAHKGDAIGDSARRVRGLLREMGHQSDLYAMTIDDELRGDVIPGPIRERSGAT